MKYDDSAPIEELRQLFRRQSLPVEKKTKRGTAEIDLAQAARDVFIEPAERGVHLTAVLSAQMPTVNPDLLLKAVSRYLPEEQTPAGALFRRIEVLDEAFTVFR